MPRSSFLASPMPRIRAWLERWGDMVPLLLAEFIVWLGFGALLPVLPLYFTEQGVDIALLGLVIAAWPAARLVGEPVFGYLADRTARVPLMVIGLIATGIFSFLPLIFVGPIADVWGVAPVFVLAAMVVFGVWFGGRTVRLKSSLK